MSGLRKFLADGGRAFTFRVKDRFTDYGLVGVMYVRRSMVEQMLMSCRVLGMDVEVGVVARIMQVLSSPAHGFEARLFETADNGPCRDLFLRCGFVETGSEQGRHLYRLNPGAAVAVPVHLKIQEEFVLGSSAAA